MSKQFKLLDIWEIFDLSKKERIEYSKWLDEQESMIEDASFSNENEIKWNKDKKSGKTTYLNDEIMDRSYMTGNGKSHKSKRAYERKYEEKRRIKNKLDFELWRGISLKTNKDTGEEYYTTQSRRNRYEREWKRRHRKGTRRALNRLNPEFIQKKGSVYKKINKSWAWY